MYKKFHTYYIYKDGTVKNSSGRILKRKYKNDEARVRLNVNGKRNYYRLPILVFTLHKDVTYEGYKHHRVLYKDGDPSNCNFDNIVLEEGSKLSQEDINSIKNLYQSNELYYTQRASNQNDVNEDYISYRYLADLYNISLDTIHRIINN